MTREKRSRVWWSLSFALVAALFAIGGVALASAQNESPAGNGMTSGDSSGVLSAVDSPRVTTISTNGSTAVVTGSAVDSTGDATRTLWYETVAGAAYAQKNGLESVDREVLDPKGGRLDSETDPVSAEGSGPDAFASQTNSSADIESEVAERAQTVGVKVVDVHYISLYGGIAEVVIQPNDISKFVGSAGSNLAALLGSLGQNPNPYLVTVVDSSGAPQLIEGFVPGVGGSNGQGVAWVAPGVQTDAIWGTPVVSSPASDSGAS